MTLSESWSSEQSDDDHYSDLFRELERIDLCLQRYADLHRERLSGHVLEDFLLDDTDIDHYIATPRGAPHWMREQEKHQYIPIVFQEVQSGGRLSRLVEQYGLTDFEVDILLLGLLPFFESRYQSLFSALQRSNQKKLPSFELALKLLGHNLAQDDSLRLSLLPQSPLLKYQLISVKKSGDKLGESWGQSLFQTAEGVCQYLTGNRYLSSPLSACARWYPPEKNEGLFCSDKIYTALQAQDIKGDDGCFPVLMLEGMPGTELVTAVRAAALQSQRAVLALDMALLPKSATEVKLLLGEAIREVRMRDAVLVLSLQEDKKEEENTEQGHLPANWAEPLQQSGLRVVIVGERQAGYFEIPGAPLIVLDVPGLSFSEKEQLLKKHIGQDVESSLDVTTFCRRFSFTHQSLPIILQEAQYYRTMRDASDIVRSCDLNRAFGLHARKDFGVLAQRKEPRRTFDDLVVSDEVKEQLTEILVAAKYRETVLEQGFATKVGYGTGVSALFCGDSGTGKTMAAEVIAGQLGVDLIKIDLSTVVNKYIGETEKNLSRIFDLAQADAGVLFFDEADALFGKRSAVNDSKDRHANIEVAYLLQRLENHPGLVILATNNRNHLDDAFSRRFTFITSFKFPDSHLREQMWRKIWPDGVRLSPSIDFSALARHAELTGANIKNIALLSAWLAAESGDLYIDEHHIALAIKRELAKVGRLPL